MHHFVVKFQNFLRLTRQGGIDPPNKSPADIPELRSLSWLCRLRHGSEALAVSQLERDKSRRDCDQLMSQLTAVLPCDDATERLTPTSLKHMVSAVSA